MNVLVAYEKFWFTFIYLCYQMPFYPNMRLGLSWQRPLSYRNQFIDLRSKPTDWFLYHSGLRHERVKILMTFIRITIQNKYYATKTKYIRTTFYIYYVYFLYIFYIGLLKFIYMLVMILIVIDWRWLDYSVRAHFTLCNPSNVVSEFQHNFQYGLIFYYSYTLFFCRLGGERKCIQLCGNSACILVSSERLGTF